MSIIEFVSQPWHWAVTGLLISLVVFLMLWAGERFGISTSFETLCTIAGAGSRIKYFNVNWRKNAWLLVFVLGSLVGGYLAVTWLQSPEPVQIAEATELELTRFGVAVPETTQEGLGYLPREVFSFKNLFTAQGFILMVVGGFLIGFGTRYAGGCTSGHAISGLANLQLASLIATVGFFIGGLVTTYILFPVIFSL